MFDVASQSVVIQQCHILLISTAKVSNTDWHIFDITIEDVNVLSKISTHYQNCQHAVENVNVLSTECDQILGLRIAFLQATTEINNIDTLKVCRKIMKITDPNLGVFLSMGWIREWNSWQNLKNYRFKYIFIDRNCFLSIIIDKKNYQFCPSVWKVGVDHYANLGYLFLGRKSTLFFTCLSIHYQTILSFYLVYRVLKHV